MKLRLKKYLKVVERLLIMLTKFFHRILRTSEVRKEMKNIETKKKNAKSKQVKEAAKKMMMSFLVENDAKLKKRKHHKNDTI